MGPTEQTPATAAELATFANDVHGYLRQNITWADQKAGFIFAGASAFLAYLESRHAFDFLRGDAPFRARHILLIAAAVSLLIAAAAAFATYWPRLKGMRAGLVFWGAIAANPSPRAYVDRVQEKTGRDLAVAKLEHSHELAKICEQKFKWADAATRFGVIGFSLAILYSLGWL